MLEKTIEIHPLLKRLLSFKNGAEHIHSFFGLYEKQLEKEQNKDTYYIRANDLRRVFLRRCREKNSSEACVRALIEFDYFTLSKLSPSHPFYVAGNPFNEFAIVLSGLHEASDSGNKATFDYLYQKHKKWIDTALEKQDIFSEVKSGTLLALARHFPDVARETLQVYFAKSFKLSKETFRSDAYRDVILTLRVIAVQKQHFEFSATTLLLLSTKECLLGIYPGYEKANLDWSSPASEHFELFKAPHELEDLFVNACCGTQVSLREKMGYLSKMVEVAAKDMDYYPLYILMHTLARAANVFEAGEYEYIEDPFFGEYIKFAINTLLRFAGNSEESVDEDGLHFTAEQKLHELLELSIDEPDIWGVENIPFIILRGFLHNNREWNLSPLYALDKLNEAIKQLKEKANQTDNIGQIGYLELRLEQLLSLIDQREFFAEKFILYLGANKPNKIAEIGVDIDKNTGLDLHERQSLAERLTFSRTSNLHDIERGWPKTTYLVASFGLVITDRPHIENGHHKRVFKTISIEADDLVIAEEKGKIEGHAEEAFYAFLLQEKKVMHLLEKFKQRFGIKAFGHKVYAVILDMHGTYDMCLSCSNQGLNFQNKFRQLLIECLKKHNLKGLTHYPEQLPIIIRYSSDLKYDYANETSESKRGILTMYQQQAGRTLVPQADNNKSKGIDIKYYGPNLLIHGKNNWHNLWREQKRSEYRDKELPLESWTAFVTAKTSSSLTQEARHFNYSRLGQVDTSKSTMTSLEQGVARIQIGSIAGKQAQKKK